MYSVTISFLYDAREDFNFTVNAENRTDAITKGLNHLEADEIKDVFAIDVKPLTEQERAELKCQSCRKTGIEGKVINGWIVCDSCYDLANAWQPEI